MASWGEERVFQPYAAQFRLLHPGDFVLGELLRRLGLEIRDRSGFARKPPLGKAKRGRRRRGPADVALASGGVPLDLRVERRIADGNGRGRGRGAPAAATTGGEVR